MIVATQGEAIRQADFKALNSKKTIMVVYDHKQLNFKVRLHGRYSNNEELVYLTK